MFTLFLNLALGLISALMVNYLADVLPIHRRFSKPVCNHCHQYKGLVSYILLSTCDSCGKGSGPRHLIVYILGPVLGLILYFFPLPMLGDYGVFLWLILFGVVVVIDLEHRLILHPVSLVGAVMGGIFGYLNHGLWDTLLGGVGGFGIMLAFYFLGELFVRILSKSRGEEITEVALGFGDVNLAGVIGLLLGWPGIIGGLFLAIILGGLVSGMYLLFQSIKKKYQAFQALPYGPFLILSVIILLYISLSV